LTWRPAEPVVHTYTGTPHYRPPLERKFIPFFRTDTGDPQPEVEGGMMPPSDDETRHDGGSFVHHNKPVYASRGTGSTDRSSRAFSAVKPIRWP